MNGFTVAASVPSHVGNALGGALAQAATQPAGPPGIAQLLQSPLLPFVFLIIILWIFTFRAKRKDEQKKKDLLDAIKRGDRVQTIGGILGKVVEVEKDRIQLKVDEGSNTKIWFSRNAVFRVLGDEKAVEVPAGR